MRSMTGFGKGQAADSEGRRVRVEIKTVNHRFLDICIRAPRLLASSEERIRGVLKQYLARGHVELFIVYTSDSAEGLEGVVDMARVSAYAQAASQIADRLGRADDVTPSQILQMTDVVTFTPTDAEADEAGRLAVDAVEAACLEVVEAREREGAALWKDVLSRADILEELAKRIEEREPKVVAEYAKRLAERVNELLQESAPPDEQRIAQEIAFFADRCNVTEEVVRVRSHLERLRTLGRQDSAQGRSLDFLAQELNREFNTIGSKSQDREVTNCVLDAKAEVEKIREQIQNIE